MGQAAGARVSAVSSAWLDRLRASYASQNAPAPRRRKSCERFARRFAQSAGALRAGTRLGDELDRPKPEPAARTRSIRAGGDSASASAGGAAWRRAACIGRSRAASRGRAPQQFGQAAGAAPRRQSPRRWLDRPRASCASQNRPPRTRSIHVGGNSASAAAGKRARRRAACVGRSCAATRGRVPRRFGQAAMRCLSAVASAMAGSRGRATAGRTRARPQRARSAPAEIPRALRALRPRSGVLLLAQGVPAQPDEGAFSGGSGNAASASAGTPARRRAACVRRWCAARRERA